jgi:glycerol transport system ATP-binding protein
MSLAAENLSLSVDGTAYLDRVDFTLQRGRLYTVLGRTQAGKTTLLRVIAGLQEPDQGNVSLDGEPLSRRPVWRRDVAMVYQQFINYPHLNVADNVAFPLRRAGWSRTKAKARAEEVLASVGLSGCEAQRPGQLSGGQQQRVALARALARRAEILLLDEPLVNLDYKLREQLREEFRGLLSGEDKGIVLYTTTDPAEAMMLGREMLVLHEGRLLQVGAPADVFDRPASMTVAAIVNDPPMNFVAGAIADGAVRLQGGLTLGLPRHMQELAPGNYHFGFRANEAAVGGSSGIDGALILAEAAGSETILHVDTPLGPLVIQVEGIRTLGIGVTVRVGIDERRLFAFAPGGSLAAAP